MLKAVIFDVDGTLVDSNDLHVQAWQRVFRHFGKEISRQAIHEQIGKGGDQLIPVFFPPEEVERHGEDMDRMRGELFMREYLPRVRPFPQVRALFERIHAQGLRMVLASSAKEDEVKRHIQSLNVKDLLEFATSADDAEHSKPCPDIFEAALARLKDVSPGEALVVGDTPYDAQAAARAGMKCLGLLSGGFSEDRLRANGMLAVYRDIAELLANFAQSPLIQLARAQTWN